MKAEKLSVSLLFVPPNRKRRDADNCLAAFKSGLDGLADVLRLDDSRWHIAFEVDRENVGGFVRVELRPC